jgi:hypothetical protein
MLERVKLQIAEALGAVNRWFCSQAYGKCVEDPDLLMTYFVKSGGAVDFDRRFNEAMSPLNRWYCSEYHRCDVRDPKLLWEYYMRFGLQSARRPKSDGTQGGRNIAC